MPCKDVPFRQGAVPVVGVFSGSWVLAAAVLGSSIEYIDGTVVNVALPSLQRSFGATGSQVQWVVEAYALFLSALLLVGGSIGDRFGFRKTFLVGVVLFACTSMWCGLSSNISQLLVARCLQGVGGALLVPNSLALLSASFPEAQRGRAIGTWSGFASIMTALGPVLGGWIVQHGSWRWAFFLNAPIALVTIWITLTKTSEAGERIEGKTLDLKGSVLATAGLSCITFSLLEWSSKGPTSYLIGVIGVVLLAAFVIVERNAKSPMMPMGLFVSRNFTGANLVTFFLYGALSGALFYLPLNLIQIQGYSPTSAGAALLPFVLLIFLLSRWAGGLVERRGARMPLIVGPLVAAFGYSLLARPDVGGSYWTTYFPAMVVLGFGMTISVAPLTTVVMTSVQDRQGGAASGVNNAVSQTAALLALALTAPLFSARFGADLTEQLRKASVPAPVAARILEERSHLGAIQTENPSERRAVDEAFVSAFRLVAVLAAASSAVAGLTAAFTIRNCDSEGIVKNSALAQ
jgi:EmrB/QacA subfamily drug resistance transporter